MTASKITALVVALLLAGCSSSGSKSVDPGAGMNRVDAQAALLTQAEVGSGLQPAKNDATRTPLPCTPKDPPLDARLPPRVQVQATFLDAAGELSFTEEIDNYGDGATVAKALALGEKGLACTKGTIRRLQVAIQGPFDLSKSVTATVDKVEAWSITSAAAKQSIVVAKIGVHLVALRFGATTGADTSAEDAAGITQRALQKVASATR